MIGRLIQAHHVLQEFLKTLDSIVCWDLVGCLIDTFCALLAHSLLLSVSKEFLHQFFIHVDEVGLKIHVLLGIKSPQLLLSEQVLLEGLIMW